MSTMPLTSLFPVRPIPFRPLPTGLNAMALRVWCYYPAAARQTDRILRFYLEESFAGRQLSEEQCRQLRCDGSDASRAIRKAS